MPEACPGLKPVEEEEEEGGQRTDRRDGLFRNESSCEAGRGARAFPIQKGTYNSSLFLMSWKNDERGQC